MLYKFRRQCYKFRRQCYDGVGNMSGQRTCGAQRIQELEPGQSNHILKATRWMWQRAACLSKLMLTASGMLKQVDAMSTSHEDIKLIKYSSQKEDIFRRISENIGRWTIKVDALGSITCTVLRSTPDDAKDVDRARYGDQGKNSRHFVSNEQIPLPVRDHIGRTTAETRQQLELKSAAHVASTTKVNN